MDWINFRHLYAFWAVCRYGGFSKAAERVCVSQSTVSAQVAQLEAYLGEQLLDRNTRSVKVTGRGAALLEYADSVFEISHEINRIFRDKQEMAGPTRIRVGMVGGFSRNFIYRCLTAALERDPGLHVELVDGSFDALTEMLRRFDLDLLFSLEQPRQRDLITLSHRRVASSPICLAGTPEVVSRILSRPVESPHTHLYMFRHPLQGLPLAETVAAELALEVDVSVMTDDISLLRFLANGGCGLAVVPQIGVKEDLESGRVRAISLKDPPRIDLYAVYLKKGARRPAVERFLGSTNLSAE